MFESIDDKSARELCELLKTLDCHATQTLFSAGDAGDSMYLIESGMVRISMKSASGDELILESLEYGAAA